METNTWQVTESAVPVQWFNPQDIVVSSTCAWHARVVVGNAVVVARYVPAVRDP